MLGATPRSTLTCIRSCSRCKGPRFLVSFARKLLPIRKWPQLNRRLGFRIRGAVSASDFLCPDAVVGVLDERGGRCDLAARRSFGSVFWCVAFELRSWGVWGARVCDVPVLRGVRCGLSACPGFGWALRFYGVVGLLESYDPILWVMLSFFPSECAKYSCSG